MHKYVINDIWTALKLSFANFFGLLFLFLFVFLFTAEKVIVALEGIARAEIIFVGFLLLVFIALIIQSIIIYIANKKYTIDLESGLIAFPRTDVENNLIEIIFFCRYWNLMRRKTIHATDIDNVYLDTKRWSTKNKATSGRIKTTKHVRYNLNIVGTFGSANLEFLERQKRDEVRSAINQCVKKHTGKNIDRKVAEFS